MNTTKPIANLVTDSVVQKTHSCYIIGEDSMVDCCVNAILEEKYDILGFCTSNNKSALFAEQNEIPCTNSLAVFESWLKENPCDFLFSIVNTRILSNSIIQNAKQFCINFHNAALPKYGGVHATSWAILNNEKFHGATWHILEEGIDTGDILKQCIFKIDDHDTGFSLNVKCIENAMPLFMELLKELNNVTYKRTKQDLKQRSYYTLYQKPKNFGVISFDSMTAEEIYALHRALNFSEYANKMCLLKFAYQNIIFFAKKINILNKKENAIPGTIVEISEKHLRIATLTDDIAISQLTDINNKNYEISDFVIAHDISEDQQLLSMDQEFLNKLRHHGERLAKFESYWVKTLEQSNSLNFLSLNASNIENSAIIDEKIIFSDQSFTEKISRISPENTNSETALITIFLLYLYRLNNYDDYSVGYKSDYIDNLIEDIHDFFAEIVPMNLNLSAEIDFLQALSMVTKSLDITKTKNTFSRDIKLRYPQLYDNTLSLPIVISTSEQIKSSNRCLCFLINKDSIKVYFPKDLDDTILTIVENMPGHLQVFISGILQNKNLHVKDIPLITESEKRLLIEEYNNTTTDYPRNSSIIEIFEQQVSKYPNNIAVKHGDDFLTYDELNEKANQLAARLISLGVKNGSIVATYFNKGINSILSIVAVIKARAIYMPIDPMYPREHIEYTLKDTGSLILLTQKKDRSVLEKCLPSGKFIILSVDENYANKSIF